MHRKIGLIIVLALLTLSTMMRGIDSAPKYMAQGATTTTTTPPSNATNTTAITTVTITEMVTQTVPVWYTVTRTSLVTIYLGLSPQQSVVISILLLVIALVIGYVLGIKTSKTTTAVAPPKAPRR
ncbi:MAG: hypothetical protein JHC33_04260 [Ignisphaera sp.]|nr:hypothetical protein [Ignisphaera sp.]